jgi:hypothetical protein
MLAENEFSPKSIASFLSVELRGLDTPWIEEQLPNWMNACLLTMSFRSVTYVFAAIKASSNDFLRMFRIEVEPNKS